MKIQFLIFVAAFACISCQHSNIDETTLDFTTAIQLQKGNYWVYQAVENNGSKSIDSLYIKKDTVINNQVYFILENQFGLLELEAKQSNTIVSLEGYIEFSATNFTDTVYRSVDGALVGVMKKVDGYVTVPAGTFKTIMFALFQRVPNGIVPDMVDATHIYYRKDWYAPGVGIVKSEFYYGGSSVFVNSLVRYKVLQ